MGGEEKPMIFRFNKMAVLVLASHLQLESAFRWMLDLL